MQASDVVSLVLAGTKMTTDQKARLNDFLVLRERTEEKEDTAPEALYAQYAERVLQGQREGLKAWTVARQLGLGLETVYGIARGVGQPFKRTRRHLKEGDPEMILSKMEGRSQVHIFDLATMTGFSPKTLKELFKGSYYLKPSIYTPVVRRQFLGAADRIVSE